MTRDFIFDASGTVIGYRCRYSPNGVIKTTLLFDPCNRLFPTARGLRLHQRLSHGLFNQLSFKEIEALEKRNEFMSGKGFIAAEEDRRCEECGQVKECRPYGPGGKQICHPCFEAHPEWEAEAKRRFSKYVLGEESA